MTVNFYRLRGIEKELKRLNGLLELYLERVHDIRVNAKPSTEDPDVSYVNDELEWLREQAKERGVSLPKDLINDWQD